MGTEMKPDVGGGPLFGFRGHICTENSSFRSWHWAFGLITPYMGVSDH